MVAVVAVWVACQPRSASAQLNGVPVWGPGMPNVNNPNAVWLVFNSTWGQDFLGLNNGPERGFTGSYRRGFDAGFTWLTAAGGIGATERDVAPSTRQVMGQAYLSLGGLIHKFPGRKFRGAVSALAGFGYSGLPDSSEEKNLVAGVDGTLRFNPGGWVLDVWLVPRWSVRWTTLAGATGSQNGFGFSTGFSGGFIAGLMARFAVDKVWLGESSSSPGLPKTEPFSMSFGLLLNF